MTGQPQPSPLKNITGGSGCGCGCLGLLVALVGMILFASLWLGVVGGDDPAVWWGGVAAMSVGLVMFCIGALAWLGSLLLD